ncbi:ImmA/IrrE family metallo-endopeptidase [Providencia stuartii]|uniref:ImmA/IrrE family metallo-endopeptidase n=1 Tax=Providencia stuartii TaxID=588 RepID=UPI0012B582BD|nr:MULTISPECIES: ImmA/IrrE family metallo-endopeptidase [Providencia]EMF0919303.1 ImmA/IrrE family metallo-endopeptidase [Providencia stuartii]MTC11900.1 ImmA/IrrE family metallo-endopeptidase [Providencia stuartii]GHC04511.1 hypothetical protein GCM10007290_36470 [Providencia thailandensis]
MTTTMQNPLDDFFTRVRKLDKKLATGLKEYLPEWWDNSLVSSEGVSQQVIFGLAKIANINLSTVEDRNSELEFNKSLCKYKHASNKCVDDLQAATAIVHGMAKIAARGMTKKYLGIDTASHLREKILNNGNKWVDFKSLLEYSWSIGVPVLYMPKLPVSKKMDAVVVMLAERPVIALTKKHKHASNLLFSLAHELGHIQLGHLDENSLIIDEKINEDDTENPLELEANHYAIELLTGNGKNGFWSERPVSGEQLAREAKRIGLEKNIDPGHVALNYAKVMTKRGYRRSFGIANKALNIMYPKVDWNEYVRELFISNIDEYELSSDKFELLCKINSIEA